MSEGAPDNQLIAEFVSITNSSTYLAEQYLLRNNGDLVEAVEDFYANNEPSQLSGNPEHPQATPQQLQQQSGSSRARGSGVRTFRDLNNDDEDSEDDKTNTNFFTGGEKSGLQVEDPNKDKNNDRSIIDQIFQKAREQMQQPDDRPSARHNDEDELSGVKFSGKGFKLGDGNEPSQVIEDPNANLKKFRPSKVTREITFWKQGFTVGDGPLHRYDDPRNATVLQELNQGRVPMSILDVEFGQDVDVSVFKKTDEDWTPPKRKIGGYHGSGHRLGSPVPGEPIVKESTPSQPPVEITDSDKPKDDQGEGDSIVQIRFANGKRTSHKFNSTDSIVKVYDFVRNHENNSDPGREFTLSHAFPVKPIEESDDVTVADAKLKNAVIVQRWK